MRELRIDMKTLEKSTGLSRSVLYKAKRGISRVSRETMEEILIAFEINKLASHLDLGQESIYEKRMKGVWYGVHWTGGTRFRSVVLARTKWEVVPNAPCKITSIKEGVEYSGRLKYDKGFIICAFDRNDGVEKEHGDLRIEAPEEDEEMLFGGIFGVDRHSRLFASPAILSRTSLSKTEAQQRLDDEPELCPRSNRQIGNDQATTVQKTDDWRYGELRDEAAELRKGDTVYITTSFFADFAVFRPILKAALHSGATVKIIFIDHREPILLRARFELRSEYDLDKNETDRSWGKKSRKVKDAYKVNLNSTLRLVDEHPSQVQLRFTRHWISGMTIKLGKKSLHAGFLYANQSSTGTPANVYKDPKSPSWKAFKREFKSVWDEARDINDSDYKFCKSRS